MKAELTDGTIVELAKDCGCRTHEGPHWLHMDDIWHRQNQRILERGGWLAAHAFSREEVLRLGEKLRYMQQQNISRIFEEGHVYPPVD